MKTIIKRTRALFILALCTVMMLAGSVQVFAVDNTGLSDDMKTAVEEYAGSLIEQLYGADDATLDSYSTQGDFAQVAVDAVKDTKSELGTFQKVGTTTISKSDDQIVTKTETSFEHYNAEIEIYYNQGDQLTPVNFVVNTEYPLSMKMAQAGENVLAEYIIVFVVLIFLAFVISLFKHIG